MRAYLTIIDRLRPDAPRRLLELTPRMAAMLTLARVASEKLRGATFYVHRPEPSR